MRIMKNKLSFLLSVVCLWGVILVSGCSEKDETPTNLTSILYLGALAIHKVVDIPVGVSIVCLAVFAGAYAIYGGLKAVFVF